MQGDSSLPISARRLLLVTAALAYGLAVLGGVMPTSAGPALSSLAVAALGAALSVYTTSRLGPQEAQPRLGSRALAAQRRYRALALASVGALYLVLVLGALVTDVGALWECLALPVCPTTNDQAQISMAHRVLAALAALLIVALAFQTWRSATQRALRVAAGWTVGLMALQVVIGSTQVLLAHGGEVELLAVRGLHLALGAACWAALVIHATLALKLPLGVRGQGSGVRDQGSEARDQESVVGGRWSAAVSLLKDYISLTKPGVITLLIFTTLAGMLITPAGLPSLDLIFWTMLGGWLMPSGAHALNCYFDRDIDVLMGRTGRRPLPSNRIPAWHALVLGLTLGAAAFAILAVFVNLLTALLALAGYLYYVVIYTLWLKRSSFSNIVIGGGAGAFPPLVGWAAATGGLTLPSLFLFAIIFYWTPPHFWALALIRQKDYARAGVPMLPVVAGDGQTKWQILLYTVLMFCLTVMPVPLGMLGLPYLAMAALLGGLFLRYAIRLLRDSSTGAAWSLYKFSLLYLALLFTAMVVDRLLLA
jgi:protoheme IX farnesyltransferase